MIKPTFYFLLVCLFIWISCQPTQPAIPTVSSNISPDWALLPFVKLDRVNPILQPMPALTFTDPILQQRVKWAEKDVYNPAAVVRDGKVYMLFRAENTTEQFAKTSRIGLAVSSDGIHFEPQAAPIFYPANDSMKIYEWEGGVEDPRVVESEDGRYMMTYTSYDGKVARLCLASSADLQSWQKHGLVLGNGKYKDIWSKSGAIVCKRVGERMIAERINGKYWMYWGDTNLYMATSEDLIHWQPVENMHGELLEVLQPRAGYFDSRLVESGPYAMLTDKGILLIYNGMNAEAFQDVRMKAGTYSAGQALFDKSNPVKLLDRTATNFFMPDKPYEHSGQVNEVVFLEGLVWFKGKWYLYYGTADSKIAVAVSEKGL